eukprot:6327936-Lingulodinium_polyedra.AAC.1
MYCSCLRISTRACHWARAKTRLQHNHAPNTCAGSASTAAARLLMTLAPAHASTSVASTSTSDNGS